MEHYDIIVLGIGGIGSAVLDQLAQRGLHAVGIDRFRPPHDRGSTHGHTRVIRQAYFEHSSYVPLLRESYRLWHELEERTGQHLYKEVGLIEIGPADGVVVPGVLRAATEHKLSVQSLTAKEINARWPGIHSAEGLVGVFESHAGYLLVEDCVAAHLAAAERAGAKLLMETTVRDWSATPREVRVQTDIGEIAAERLVITAGPWAGQLLADLSVPLSVSRKSLFWFATGSSQYDVAEGFPVFLFEVPVEDSDSVEKEKGTPSIFYGFPQLDDRGVKMAEHGGGRLLKDPLTVDRSIDAEEQQRLINVARKWLPGVSPRVTDHAVCMYTMSPDEMFIVDRHPMHANVVFAAGLSGHGFKFAPVIGRALSEMALEGSTQLPIDFLSLRRLRCPAAD
jgi:monomeric sarcosine oxidase